MILEDRFTYSRFGQTIDGRLVNVHERVCPGTLADSARLLEGILDPASSVWPFEKFRLEMDNGLAPGSTGGHGPIRYAVTEHAPGLRVKFAFTDDAPIAGWHEFRLEVVPHVGVRWRHELVIDPVNDLVREQIEPRHDEVLEILLDRAQMRLVAVQ